MNYVIFSSTACGLKEEVEVLTGYDALIQKLKPALVKSNCNRGKCKPNAEWYDEECREKKKLKIWQKKLKQNHNDLQFLDLVQTCRIYKHMKKTKKKSYCQHRCQQLELAAMEKDVAKFWALVSQKSNHPKLYGDA